MIKMSEKKFTVALTVIGLLFIVGLLIASGIVSVKVGFSTPVSAESGRWQTQDVHHDLTNNTVTVTKCDTANGNLYYITDRGNSVSTEISENKCQKNPRFSR